METLKNLLQERNLREFAGISIFSRGATYFRSDRVQIKYADDQDAECIVRGTSYYTVKLWLHRGEDLGTTCSCPFAANGWFCKHMVAAGLAVADYLDHYGDVLWRPRLDVLLEGIQRKNRKQSKPYWLFVSLQRQSYGWKLQPNHLWINQIPNGVLPDDSSDLITQLPELVKHNQWILENVKSNGISYLSDSCLNGDEENVAFVNLLIQQNKQNENRYQYYYHSDPYDLAFLLPVLARMNLPLYLGDIRNPIRSYLTLLRKPVVPGLEMNHFDEGLKLSFTLRNGLQNLDLAFTRAEIITTDNNPWVMNGSHVFQIRSDVDIEYISPWLQNPILDIPADQEDQFIEEYFSILAEQIPIEGPDILWEDVREEPIKRLYLTDEPSIDTGQQNDELQVHLRFGYGDYEVNYEKGCPEVSVRRKPDSWTISKIYRDPLVEEQVWGDMSSAHHGLKRAGKNFADDVFLLRARVHPIDFLMRHVPRLVKNGFEIYGEEKLKSNRVNRNKPTLSLNVSSGIDWFDLQAVVKFGEIEAAFSDVRRAVKRKERYIKLADGTIGEIPDEWIQRYRHLFGLGEQTENGVRLDNHHVAIIDQLLDESDQSQFDPEFHRRKKRLLEFEGIQIRELPKGFSGDLRPYQKAGFDWLHFLHDYNFGGCLADDMGLGKTVEALVFLQSLKELGEGQKPALLVLPRSLLVNWQREADRFTPDLIYYEYFGSQRAEDLKDFDEYDLILTTYGVMLRDIDILRQYRFHLVILDESQAIKNPLSKTSRAARLLNTNHRLALTGTPVENSTFELWSQFAFLNPGLLGSLEYFKREFGNPIERQGDETTSENLRNLVFPFILRRTKEQVAPELPPRTERIVYADMEPAQRNLYDKTRDYYRAMLMGVIEEEGMNHARMKVLEGLLRLRQISNHPRLVKDDFRGTSAKFELLIDIMVTLQSTGHKALVFSQFVQMLKILREEMDQREMPYVYLDGRTRKRQERVDTFQEDQEIPFFLISLKAGGVGLNLTAADYVIHIDPWWNPAVEMQATDRTHRIGQFKPVFVYKLIVRGSVEEKILLLQEKKKALVEQLITTESSFVKSLTADDVGVLFS